MRPILFMSCIFLCLFSQLYAQNREPSAFNLSTSASVISTNAGVNIIARGWNWGSVHREVSGAMKAEFEHGGNITDYKPTGMNLIVPPPGLGGNKNDNFVTQGLAMHYSPATAIEEVAVTNNTGRYTLPASGDNTGAAFGFRYRARGTVATIDGVQRFRLLTTDVVTTTGTLVLDSPWPDDVLERFNNLNPIGSTNANEQISSKSGDRWYISINLRPLDPGDGIGDDEVILKIKVPAIVDLSNTTATDQHYIVFEPSDNPLITTQANVHTAIYDNRNSSPSSANFRGRAYYWTPPGGESTTLAITRKMLSRSSHPDSLDMPVSAFFQFDIISPLASNPYYLGEALKNSNSYNAIMQTGIEVEYCGKSPVAISWIRFETEYGQEYFRGAHDAEIRDNLEAFLNTFKDPVQNPSGCKLFRFYGLDEAPPMQFWAMRYLNRVTGGLAMTELGTDYAPHYTHIVQPAEYWTGGAVAGDKERTAPYIAYGASDYDPEAGVLQPRSLLMLGHYSGYIGDTRSSGTVYRNYDMRVKDENIYLEGVSIPAYVGKMTESKGSVSNLTGTSMAAYFWSVKENYPHNLIFSQTPWWTQVWCYSNWALATHTSTTGTIDQTAMLVGTKPLTGEELRATTWLPILLGAKGIMYYQERTSTIDFSSQYAGTAFIGLTSGENAVTGITGATIVTSNTLLGGDFLDFSSTASLDINGWVNWSDVRDLSQLDRWIPHLSTRATALGIPPTRLYLGRESCRKIVYECNDWLDRMESELTTLQLKGWLCKHFRTTVTTATQSDLAAFNGRILLTSTATQTRQIGHTNYEAPDSSIYHITYLEPQSNPDNRFYIGVLNGRLDPIVVVPTTATFTVNSKTVNGTSYGHPTAATLPAISVGQEFRFFTTAEFDALSTTATPVPSGKLGRYSQLGAREIAIRFNYSTSDTDYQLLRIQELGGGLDTVVGEDSQLAVLYKPGEGKLFRVIPLPAPDKPTGDLAYSNQRKTIAYPKQGSQNELYYHMAYQRTTGGVSGVYYRRSKVVTTGTISENIEWDIEKQLTVTTASGIQCGYPSLVVRNNSVGIPTVYVVYACTGANIPAANVQIVENMFNADADYSTTGTGKGLYMSKGSTLATWGTPVVSAGARGNYYAWADKDMGIVVGYKSTSATSISAVKFVSWATTGTKTCLHPSLNTYSRIAWQENEAALVWQEEGHIYYTRIYDATTGTTKLRVFPAAGNVVFNTSSTIARLSEPDCSSQNEFPVVYRSIETDYRWQYPWGYLDGLFDRVFWEAVKTTGERIVCARKIDLSDVVSLTMGREFRRAWFSQLSTISYTRLLPFPFRGLHQVDVAQGRLSMQNGHNMSDSAVVVSLISSTQSGSSAYGNIWHIPLHYWTSLVNSSYALADLRNSSWQVATNVRQPHLAAKPSFNTVGSWHLNRRVFENTGSSILTSASRFYRTIRDEEGVTPLPGFAKSCTRYIIAEPYIDAIELPWKAQVPEVVVNLTDTLIRARLDTIFTDWFPIGSSADISFYAMGTDTSLVQLELVKESDGSRQTLALEPVTDTTARLITRTVINGGGDMYRLEMRKQDAHAGFIEDILLGQLAVEDGMGGVVAARRGTDFSSGAVVNIAAGLDHTPGLHAHVYPNPAGEAVFISVYYSYNAAQKPEQTKDLAVTVVNALGEVVYRAQALPGAVLRMDTSALPPGVYFVQVESPTTGQTSGTASFIVNR